MRSLVIYGSRYGNTERIGRAIVAGLSERGESQAVALSPLRPGDLAKAQLVVLGAPTRMMVLPLAMRRFLRRSGREALFGRPVAVFDTRSPGDRRTTGSAGSRLATRLQRSGALSLVPPESFFVTGIRGPLRDGEVLRATLWGRRLHLGDRVTAEEG